MAHDDDDNAWHLDKKVPIALLVAIFLQFGGFIWFASDSNTRLTMVEKRLEAAAPQSDRLTRVEEQLKGVKEGILEIKAMLNRSHPPGASP